MPSSSLSFSAAITRQHDNDRYLCSLFSNNALREGLFSLYAFNYEIAKIRESVTEPMSGFIRLQWWQEAIDALYAGEPPRHHEVLIALHRLLLQKPLSQHLFNQLIQGREHDFDEAPPATLAALESYAADSCASLFQLALQATGVTTPEAHQAAYHLGIAWALIGYLRSIRFYAASKRVLFPQDHMEAAGITAQDIINGHSLEKTIPLVKELTARAETHLDQVRALRPSIPKSASAVFLPAVIARLFITRIKKEHWQLFHTDLEGNRLAIQCSILWNGLVNRG